MNLKKLTNEELIKSYERLCKRHQKTKEDIEYKKKVKEELLKRFGY
jgi:hypothetical protein